MHKVCICRNTVKSACANEVRNAMFCVLQPVLASAWGFPINRNMINSSVRPSFGGIFYTYSRVEMIGQLTETYLASHATADKWCLFSKQRGQTLTGLSFLNMDLCCFSLLLSDGSSNVFGVWTAGWTKQETLSCHLEIYIFQKTKKNKNCFLRIMINQAMNCWS